MNYSDFLDTISEDMKEAVALINNPEIAPEIRRRNFEILFKEIGDDIYFMVYDMNAFDFEIQGTIGKGQSNAYYNLAKVASDGVTTSNRTIIWDTIDNWMNNVVGKAQYDAAATAISLGKYVVVKRSLRGSKSGPCEWCKSKVGTHIAEYGQLDPSVFGRHSDCHCAIETEGFNSRNGTLNNYKRGSKYVGEDKDYQNNQGFYEVERNRSTS